MEMMRIKISYPVNLLVLKYVGGSSLDLTTLRIEGTNAPLVSVACLMEFTLRIGEDRR